MKQSGRRMVAAVFAAVFAAVLTVSGLMPFSAAQVHAADKIIDSVTLSHNDDLIHLRSDSTEAEIQTRIRYEEGAVGVETEGLVINRINTYLNYWNEEYDKIYGIGDGQDAATPFRAYYIDYALVPQAGYDWTAGIKNLKENENYRVVDLDDFVVYDADGSMRNDAVLRYNSSANLLWIELPIYYLRYSNTLNATGKTVKVSYKKLRKANQVIKRSKAFSVSKAKGKVQYKLLSVKKAKYKKYFKVASSTGKLTVKKRLAKGTYKVRIKVSAEGTPEYYYGSKNATVTVKVR